MLNASEQQQEEELIRQLSDLIIDEYLKKHKLGLDTRKNKVFNCNKKDE